ncbi:MAG: hypothetical protein LBT97_02865 [Planctomycetota bacterium]|jgi:hypothetical protein|nr:hypothetical protein [Planctomycetota bacterium]
MAESGRKRGVYAQLALGAAERGRFSPREIIDRLGRAADIVRPDGLVFWPSGDAALDGLVRGRCRELGLDLYLWLPVLADAGFDPAERDLAENAWGGGPAGGSGAWARLGSGDETFRFACPFAEGQAGRIRARCRDELPGYDGVFLDRIRYPSPANGLENLFTCFCPRCLERTPALAAWRDNARGLRERLRSATDVDLGRWGTFQALLAAFGLPEFAAARSLVLAEAVAGPARLARGMGKLVALDLFTPSLAALVGQDFRLLGGLADWIKPMIYCRARGPSGLPLELACFARGLLEWGRFSGPEVMAFVARSFSLPAVPRSADELESGGVDLAFAAAEYAAARGSAAVPIHPGFECVRHPDFDLDPDGDGIRRCLAAFSAAPAVVLAWNILYTPDDFLRIVAEGRPPPSRLFTKTRS